MALDSMIVKSMRFNALETTKCVVILGLGKKVEIIFIPRCEWPCVVLVFIVQSTMMTIWCFFYISDQKSGHLQLFENYLKLILLHNMSKHTTQQQMFEKTLHITCSC